VLLLVALATIPFFGGSFCGVRERPFRAASSAAPGTSLTELTRIGQLISAELLKNSNHIATVEQQVGRASKAKTPGARIAVNFMSN